MEMIGDGQTGRGRKHLVVASKQRHRSSTPVSRLVLLLLLLSVGPSPLKSSSYYVVAFSAVPIIRARPPVQLSSSSPPPRLEDRWPRHRRRRPSRRGGVSEQQPPWAGLDAATVVLRASADGASGGATSDVDDDSSSSSSRRLPIDLKRPRLIVRSMVYFLLFALGYRLGTGSTGQPSVGLVRSAADAAATTTRRFPRRFPVASILLVALLIRELWRSIPPWAKPRIVSRFLAAARVRMGGSSDDVVEETYANDDDPDDMTSMSAIFAKLQGVLTTTQSKLASPIKFNVQGALLALLQLSSQVKERTAHSRDELYVTSGEPCAAKDLDGLDESFEFADWAYDESSEGSLKENLQRCGFVLLKHDKTPVPGYLGHYVALNKKRNLALIGVKGTSTFEDLLTDCCGAAVTHRLEDGPFVEGGNDEIRCHEGVLISSRRLADDVQPFVEEMFLPRGYDVLVVGHSLGAAGAALVGVLLRSRIAMLRSDVDGSKLKVLAFASPPALDYENALACRPFATTVVNNSDIIPRSSVANLVVMLKLLRAVNERLEERGMDSKDPASTLALVRKLAEGNKGELLMEPTEILEVLDQALLEIGLIDPDHLYVPGRALVMYDLWEKSQGAESGQKVTAGAEVGEQSEAVDDERTAEGAFLADGTAKVLRYIGLDKRVITDHDAQSYRTSIRSLLTLAP